MVFYAYEMPYMIDVSQGVNVRELRANLAEVLGRVGYGNERIMVFKHERAVAALISIPDLRKLVHFEHTLRSDYARKLRDEDPQTPEERALFDAVHNPDFEPDQWR